MWTVLWVALGFMAGVILGSITMEGIRQRRECCERRQMALELLWWVEGARKAGTLDKVLPETIKKMGGV
jgi:hypothetical protein